MAEANKGSREMATSTTCVFPRDLLQRFMSTSGEEEEEDDEEEEEAAIELNLGLSLGGRFGVDKTGPSKLKRSSSVVVTMPLFRENQTVSSPSTTKPLTAMKHTGLIRTTSLPAESEEEWRKRKEMQTLRRLAAKRRRSEKLRSGNNTKGEITEEATASRPRGRPSMTSSGLPRWSAAANKGGFLRQQSVESQTGGGGSSSSLSELENKSNQGSSNCSEEGKSSTSNRLRRLSSVDMNLQQGKGKSEMPCVFTKGDGPNGRRVDGILYRYGNGEEVRIMCVCHGNFLSPADFVKHAGGSHVDHPLRHIVVNTSSPFL